MLLILDLDETLVFASIRRLERPPDFEVGEYFPPDRFHVPPLTMEIVGDILGA